MNINIDTPELITPISAAVLLNTLHLKELITLQKGEPFDSGKKIQDHHFGHRWNRPIASPGISDFQSLRGHRRRIGHGLPDGSKADLRRVGPVSSHRNRMARTGAWAVDFRGRSRSGCSSWRRCRGSRWCTADSPFSSQSATTPFAGFPQVSQPFGPIK